MRVRTVIKEIYVAEDGTEFDNMIECDKYEKGLKFGPDITINSSSKNSLSVFLYYIEDYECWVKIMETLGFIDRENLWKKAFKEQSGWYAYCFSGELNKKGYFTKVDVEFNLKNKNIKWES